jgi:hypothetical protein
MAVDAGPPGSGGLFGDVNAAVAACRGYLADGSMARSDVVNLAIGLTGAAIDLLRMAAEMAAVAGSADADTLDRGIELAEDGQQRMVSAWQFLAGTKALAEATL